MDTFHRVLGKQVEMGSDIRYCCLLAETYWKIISAGQEEASLQHWIKSEGGEGWGVVCGKELKQKHQVEVKN